MNRRDAAGCLVVLLGALFVWAVLAAVLWLGQDFHMLVVAALIALFLLGWLWTIPAARRLQPDVAEDGAVLAGASGAKPLGLLGALAGLWATLAGLCLTLGSGYGLIGLLLGGLRSSGIRSHCSRSARSIRSHDLQEIRSDSVPSLRCPRIGRTVLFYS